ncbi:MAG: thiamine pyrophosphate-binding protein [Chloroflexi bacterium]|nr:thiamine pyrophosphate-binding protein [Chloroflexota bacterium]
MGELTKVRGAEAVIKTLEAEKVDLAVGVIGHAAFEMADALLDSSIKNFHPTLEYCGAHIAEGYNRLAGRAAAVVMGTAASAPMIISGLANASLDSVPMVGIVGTTSTRHDNKNPMQLTPAAEMARPLVKWSTKITQGELIPEVLHMAFRLANSGRPGPVLVEIPYDMTVDKFSLELPQPSSGRASPAGRQIDRRSIERAVALLNTAKRPAILSGGGVLMAGAESEIKELAEYLTAPVSTSVTGRGVISQKHELSVGQSGVFGARCANQILDEADVLLAVGHRFAEFSYAQQWTIPAQWKLIHIDIDQTEVGKVFQPAVGIAGDAKEVLRELLAEVKREVSRGTGAGEWFNRCQDLKKKWQAELTGMCHGGGSRIAHGEFMQELRRTLPDEALLFCEPTSTTVWAQQAFETYLPRTFHFCGGYAHIGWAFPAAMGAKLARPEKQVVSISGDWTFHYSIPEIPTALKENIPVVCIVFDDGTQVVNKQFQIGAFDGRTAWVDQKNPDFVKLADAFGMKATRIERAEDIRAAVEEALAANQPYMLVANIDPTTPLPGTGKLDLRW